MTELSNLEGGPPHLRHAANQPLDDTRLTDIPGVPAHDHNRHAVPRLSVRSPPPRFRRARSRRYSFQGPGWPAPEDFALTMHFFTTQNPCAASSQNHALTHRRMFSNSDLATYGIAPSSTTLEPEIPVWAAMTTFFPITQLWPICTRLSIFVPAPILSLAQSATIDGRIRANLHPILDDPGAPVAEIGRTLQSQGSAHNQSPPIPTTAPACTVTSSPRTTLDK